MIHLASGVYTACNKSTNQPIYNMEIKDDSAIERSYEPEWYAIQHTADPDFVTCETCLKTIKEKS